MHLDAVRTFLALCFQKWPSSVTFERLLAIPSMTVLAVDGLFEAHVPVLLLYDGKDKLVDVQPTVARAKALNSEILAKIYPNSGHAPFLDEASRFSDDLD